MATKSPWIWAWLWCWLFCAAVHAFEFPNPFLVRSNQKNLNRAQQPQPSSLSRTKQALLQTVSGTNNGKSATLEQQVAALKLVRELETLQPAPSTILTKDASRIQGVWYLQYTSPSNLPAVDADWKPLDATEGEASIPTQAAGLQGAVSAQGIVVETANRVVTQTIATATTTSSSSSSSPRVTNNIQLNEWTNVTVGGTFRVSSSVPTRAVVSFDTADISTVRPIPWTLSLGWLFPILAMFRNGSRETGWLETTYIDDDMRIGRGNKGTLFVLTRAPDAVTA